jgi:peptidoglycan/LPS O-acetylase OafA/YrhL
MPIASNRNIPHLDGWRGTAILGVLLAHFLKLEALGGFGVQMFFVLSGLLMGQLLFVKQVGLKSFFFRRFSRVLPTFWLFTAAMVIYAAHFQRGAYHVPFSELASVLAFLRTYYPADPHIWSNNWPIEHFWSLNVEEHSYAYLALGAVLLRLFRRRPVLDIFLAGSTGVVLLLTAHQFHVLGDSTYWAIQSQYAALGLLASASYGVLKQKYASRLRIAVPGLLPILAFLIALLCYTSYRQQGLHLTAAPLLLAFAVNHLNAVPVIVRKLLSAAWLRWLGVCSFSLYLWQQPFHHAAKHDPAHSMLYLIAAIAAGALSFYLFENPVRSRLNAWWEQTAERAKFRRPKTT